MPDTVLPREYRYRIEGMDCPSCAGKIETALRRKPGVASADVNFGAASLRVAAADEARLGEVEATVRGLGFEPRRLDGDDTAPAAPDEPPLWRSAKALIVAGIAGLIALGYGATVLGAPERWAYGVAVVLGMLPFVHRAIMLARAGSPFSIETLMSTAAIGALLIGESMEAAIVVLLFAIGELLESVAAGRARSGIRALVSLVPRTAMIEDEAGALREVPAARLAVGQTVLVRPGARVPTDGTILSGASSLDESPVTGESMPVARAIGDGVYAGTINLDAALRVRVTTPPADNTIARIVRMVEEAQESKAPTARFIERFSRYYTPGAMLVSALTIVIPPLLLGGDWSTWIYRGLALLLIACPCALVLSTPAAIASGLAAGARRGLLIKGGAALETVGKVGTVAFDKTGTLTAGRPQVTDIVALSGDADEALALAAAVEAGSSHPLAAAIVASARERGLPLPGAEASQAVAGKAVTGTAGGRHVAVGSPRYAAEIGVGDDAMRAAAARLEDEGKTAMVVIVDGVARAIVAVRDEPRADAAQAIAELKALGVHPVMLTGDNRRTGAAIATTLGLDVRAELLPDEKLKEIARLRADGRPVAMVGDGINDAPALAAASVGVAMGGGTDVALETADAALVNGRVRGVADLVRLSRATLHNIRQNIVVSVGLKLLFLATTLTGTTTMWMAILADTGATILVTLNALRLLRLGSKKETAP